MEAKDYLNLIYNSDAYRGYKNSTFLNTVFLPNLELINKNNLPLSKEEIRTLESKVCTGKGNSLLADSLYNNIDILKPLTKTILLNEKFVIRILDILALYKSKSPNKVYDFEWVYNLRNLGFKFSDTIIENLKNIGYVVSIDLNKKYDVVEIEFISTLVTCNKTFLDDIKSILQKNPQFVPKKEYVDIFYSNIEINYFKKNRYVAIEDLNSLYKLFINNGYKCTYSDLENFMTLFSNMMIDIYSNGNFLKETNLNFYEYFNSIMNMFYNDGIYVDYKIIRILLTPSYKRLGFSHKHNYNFDKTYGYYVYYFHDFMKLFMANSNNKIPKMRYLEMLSFNNYNYYSDNNILDKFFGSYKDLIKLLLTNNLLELENETYSQLILNRDKIAMNYILTECNIVPTNDMMNMACYSHDIVLIQNFINQKMIPNINNVKHIKSINSSDGIRTLNTLLDNGCILDEELMDYLISKKVKISDREKYGWNTEEAKEIIINLSIKNKIFLYDDINCKYDTILSKINTTTSAMELEDILYLFDNDQKMKCLLDHLVSQNNITLLYYLKRKTKVVPSYKVIYKSDICDLYLDLFDLKDN